MLKKKNPLKKLIDKNQKIKDVLKIASIILITVVSLIGAEAFIRLLHTF